MRIAIATQNGEVSAHFGQAPEFVIVDIENEQVVKKETVASPGHGHGIVPHFLAQYGVKAVIAGGMGENAIQRCQQYGIEPILSIQGPIDTVIDQYLKKQLQSVPVPCEGMGARHRSGQCHDQGQHHGGEC